MCVRQNPDIVLVHYLNVPSLEDSGRCSPLLCTVSDRHDGVRWSRDDLLNQLRPMCKNTHTQSGLTHIALSSNTIPGVVRCPQVF